MCIEKYLASYKENKLLHSDMLKIYNQSMYLSRRLAVRPEAEVGSTTLGIQSISNLETAMNLITPNSYTPPDGMVYTVRDTVIRQVLAKYKLDDKWLVLDAVYKVPRWDYMQLLYLWDWTNKKQYIPQFGDCDKFAWIFRDHYIEYAMLNGIMFVIDYSSSHSYNLLFDLKLKDGTAQDIDITASKLIAIEPQSDKWHEVQEPKSGQPNPNGYKLIDCYLIM